MGERSRYQPEDFGPYTAEETTAALAALSTGDALTAEQRSAAAWVAIGAIGNARRVLEALGKDLGREAAVAAVAERLAGAIDEACQTLGPDCSQPNSSSAASARR